MLNTKEIYLNIYTICFFFILIGNFYFIESINTYLKTLFMEMTIIHKN